ncbi:RNA polymerase sigma factor [Streptomyces parvus]|uniref:RNA polymerase sigma factor n=1 Tax=Streptomyces parvus TaxID=66428 RepID=UPI003808A109
MHARIRAGDPDAFRELFRDHAQLVYRHAVRTAGDWSATEDVVSLTFLEARRLRGKLRDEGASPRPWLMATAVTDRAVVDAVKQRPAAPAPGDRPVPSAGT